MPGSTFGMRTGLLPARRLRSALEETVKDGIERFVNV